MSQLQEQKLKGCNNRSYKVELGYERSKDAKNKLKKRICPELLGWFLWVFRSNTCELWDAFLFPYRVSSELSPFLSLHPLCSWLLELTSEPEELTQHYSQTLIPSPQFVFREQELPGPRFNTLLLWVGQRSLCAIFHQQDWIIFLFMWYLLLPIILSKTAFCIDVFVASKAFGMSRSCMLIYLTKTAFITFFLQHTHKPICSQTSSISVNGVTNHAVSQAGICEFLFLPSHPSK